MSASERVSAEEQACEEVELAPGPEAARLARAALEPLVADFAGDAGFRARLALTELVANCVRHARLQPGERIAVRIATSPGTVRVELRGACADFRPRLGAAPAAEATSGRGLLIVDAVVDRWGSDHGALWFEIDRPTREHATETNSGIGDETAAR